MSRYINKIFEICTRFLNWSGRWLHVGYMGISVIVNIWIQGGVLIGAVLFPLVVSVVKLCETANAINITSLMFCAVNALFWIWFMMKIILRYRLPFNSGFWRCVDDLKRLAAALKMTYKKLNVMIFIVAYVIVVVSNVMMGVLILKP